MFICYLFCNSFLASKKTGNFSPRGKMLCAKYVFVELRSKFFRVEFEQNFDIATSAMSNNVTNSHDGNLNEISTKLRV